MHLTGTPHQLIGIRFSSVAGERPTNPLDNGVSVVEVKQRGAEL